MKNSNKNKTDKKTDNPELVEVELLKPHNHANRDYKAGCKITISTDQAEWLRGCDVII